AAGDLGGIRLVAGVGRALGGEVLGEVEHVLARHVLDEGLHRDVLAPALLEVPQLEEEVAGRLAREDGELRHGGGPVRAVAGRTGRGLGAARLGILPQRRRGEAGRERGPEQLQLHSANTNMLLPRLKSSCVLPPQPMATYCLPLTV